ncbi:hypothetical protein SLA2020_217180 [Shorea laevis]
MSLLCVSEYRKDRKSLLQLLSLKDGDIPIAIFIWIHSSSINLAGLLPREAWQIKRGSCALFTHDCMEGCNTLIESKTKKKIVFVKNKRLKSTLLCDIDECQLPDIHGGKTIFGYHAGLLSPNLFPLVSP